MGASSASATAVVPKAALELCPRIGVLNLLSLIKFADPDPYMAFNQIEPYTALTKNLKGLQS